MPLPGPIPVSLRSLTKQINHDHTGDEASNVCPECDSARSLTGFRNGSHGAAQKLSHKPVAKHQPRWDVKEEYGREPDQHSCPRIQNKIRAHYTRNRAARAYARHTRCLIHQNVRGAGGQSADKVKHEILEVSDVVF